MCVCMCVCSCVRCVSTAQCLRCAQFTMLSHRNAAHCVTPIRYWCYQVDRSTFNAHVKRWCLTLTFQDAGSRLARKAIRDNKALKKKKSLNINHSYCSDFVRSVYMSWFGWEVCSGKLKVSIVLGQEVVARREEMRRSRGGSFTMGRFISWLDQQKRSCSSVLGLHFKMDPERYGAPGYDRVQLLDDLRLLLSNTGAKGRKKNILSVPSTPDVWLAALIYIEWWCSVTYEAVGWQMSVVPDQGSPYWIFCY